MKKNIISRLLSKYEKSKHLLEPGVSTRRVMLKIEKKELPEYDYQDASVRDAYNIAAQELEANKLVTLEWMSNHKVISTIALNLEHVNECYHLVGRKHPKEQAITIVKKIEEALSSVSTEWVVNWGNEICKKAKNELCFPSYCKEDTVFLSELLRAFMAYDLLRGESITMRAFSSRCYHDSKYFERNIRDEFLRIAEKYCLELSELCNHKEMGTKNKLAYLGIYARPEIYELSGNFSFKTSRGSINVEALMPYGIALPSTVVDTITSVNLENIKKIVFIENKTNYDEYLISEMADDELVIYHGGFLSPQKRKMFSIISSAVSHDVPIYFWADIDLGGFQMFTHLQQLIPNLLPMRMSGEDVHTFHELGLVRSTKYLEKLKTVLKETKYPLFEDAIKCILYYGVTIEQEVFLAQ